MFTRNARNAMKYVTLTLLATLVIGCAKEQPQFQTMGSVERLDSRLDKLVDKDAPIEVIAEGFEWSEGPLWIEKGNYLLFSDVPKNAIYKWEDKPGNTETTVYLEPSGYTGKAPRKGEMGSNGLTLDNDGRLTICQHGDRRVARVEDDGKWTTLAAQFEGRRFNSPNDLVFRTNGDLYFTDPPFGLPKVFGDPQRELDFCGVYLLTRQGKLVLLTRDIKAPNGIALSPDEKTLYVTDVHPQSSAWLAYDVKADGRISNGRVLHDATRWTKTRKGAPDGLKVDAEGNLFATGPEGVYVFAPDGTHLGIIETGVATANCAWGDDGKTLYIAADTTIYRIKLSTKGARF